MPAHSPALAPAQQPDATQIADVIPRFTHLEGPLLPILHGMQEDFGFVPQTAIQAALSKLGTTWHGTTANGSVTIEPVYCLGLCASGPAAMVDDRLHAQLDAGKIETLLGEVM